jgi:hypothetical protein
MGKLRFVALSLAIAACGSDDRNGPADASIDAKVVSPDAKVWMDAPPGPDYDLTCFGMTPGTTVGEPIVLSGTAGSADQSGNISGLEGIEIQIFKAGASTATKTVTSTAGGAFTSGYLTGGVAIDHFRATLPNATPNTPSEYRTTYLYPPQPFRMTLDGIPVPIVNAAQFDQIAAIGNQDDDMYGAMLVTVTDCNIAQPQLIDGATLHVQKNGQEVGDPFDLAQIGAAGTFFVFNVPDGDVDVFATYDGKTFPTRTVTAYKKPAGPTGVGTITVTVVPPGPVY